MIVSFVLISLKQYLYLSILSTFRTLTLSKNLLISDQSGGCINLEVFERKKLLGMMKPPETSFGDDPAKVLHVVLGMIFH